MKIEILSGRTLTFAATLMSATIASADDIILHADFDSDELGAPSSNPTTLPEADSLNFASGTYIVVSDPLLSGNQYLEAISPIMPGKFSAYPDPIFDSANATDSIFEIGWTAAAGANTSATFSVVNGGAPSLFIAYHGPSQTIRVSDENGQSVLPPNPVSFTPETFQDFKIDVDFSTDTYSLEVDGSLVGSDLPLITGSAKGFSELKFDYATDLSLTSGMPFAPGSPPPVGILSVDTIYALEIDTQSTIEASFDVRSKAFFIHRHFRGRGIIPVVIHGSEALDVTKIDLESLDLNGLSLAKKWGRTPHFIHDITSPDGRRDGFADLVCVFKYDRELWENQDEDAFYLMSGFLQDGELLIGTEEAKAWECTTKSRRSWHPRRSLRAYKF